MTSATESFAGSSGTWQYHYDDPNRLLTAADSGFGLAAPIHTTRGGNRLTESPSGTFGESCFSQTLSYNPNKPSNPNTNGPGQLNSADQYCFDASGDLLDDGTCPTSGGHKYTYDGEGRMATANYGAETFIYDADGRRVGVYNGSAYANVMYEDVTGEPMSQWTNNQQNGTRDLWVGGRHAGYIFNNVMTWTAGDWLGSERVRTSSSGNLVASFMTLPYGNGQTALSGSDNDVIHYTGKQRDTNTDDIGSVNGMDYFGARLYSSATGRFMNPDPSGLSYAAPTNPQSLNLYSYAQNNPITNIDPTGMECVWDDGSFDSADDAQTGSQGGCSSAGGTYIDHDAFSTLNAGDWSAQPNSDIASVASTLSASNNYTNVTVSADGSGCVDQTYVNLSDNVQYLMTNDSSTGPDPMIALATAVTADSQHSIGCIAQAYGISGAGGAVAAGLGAPTIAKPFAARGAAQGTSVASKGLAALANKAGVPRGRYPSPTGGLFSGGQELKMMTSPNAGRALGRFVPYGVNAAATAYAVYQLGKCL